MGFVWLRSQTNPISMTFRTESGNEFRMHPHACAPWPEA